MHRRVPGRLKAILRIVRIDLAKIGNVQQAAQLVLLDYGDFADQDLVKSLPELYRMGWEDAGRGPPVVLLHHCMSSALSSRLRRSC